MQIIKSPLANLPVFLPFTKLTTTCYLLAYNFTDLLVYFILILGRFEKLRHEVDMLNSVYTFNFQLILNIRK